MSRNPHVAMTARGNCYFLQTWMQARLHGGQPKRQAKDSAVAQWATEAPTKSGGARRDRTDDLKLAKLPLSQLSYGPKL
jgi:hypothetical protein